MSNGGRDNGVVVPRLDGEYYPPLSDNRYKGLIYWWTFSELRANPEQLVRYIHGW